MGLPTGTVYAKNSKNSGKYLCTVGLALNYEVQSVSGRNARVKFELDTIFSTKKTTWYVFQGTQNFKIIDKNSNGTVWQPINNWTQKHTNVSGHSGTFYFGINKNVIGSYTRTAWRYNGPSDNYTVPKGSWVYGFYHWETVQNLVCDANGNIKFYVDGYFDWYVNGGEHLVFDSTVNVKVTDAVSYTYIDYRVPKFLNESPYTDGSNSIAKSSALAVGTTTTLASAPVEIDPGDGYEWKDWNNTINGYPISEGTSLSFGSKYSVPTHATLYAQRKGTPFKWTYKIDNYIYDILPSSTTTYKRPEIASEYSETAANKFTMSNSPFGSDSKKSLSSAYRYGLDFAGWYANSLKDNFRFSDNTVNVISDELYEEFKYDSGEGFVYAPDTVIDATSHNHNDTEGDIFDNITWYPCWTRKEYTLNFDSGLTASTLKAKFNDIVCMPYSVFEDGSMKVECELVDTDYSNNNSTFYDIAGNTQQYQELVDYDTTVAGLRSTGDILSPVQTDNTYTGYKLVNWALKKPASKQVTSGTKIVVIDTDNSTAGNIKFKSDYLENYYSIDKRGFNSVYTQVTPTGSENPNSLKWLEIINGVYTVTSDTSVNTSKTYYTVTVTMLDAYSIAPDNKDFIQVSYTMDNDTSNEIDIVSIWDYDTSTYIFNNGEWKVAMPYVFNQGEWKTAIGYVNNNEWKV